MIVVQKIDVMAMIFVSNLKATNSMGFIWIWFIWNGDNDATILRIDEEHGYLPLRKARKLTN
jgi:hypothetical protein